MTIDSAYYIEERDPITGETRFYYEFETAVDSAVEVYLFDPLTGKYILAAEVV